MKKIKIITIILAIILVTIVAFGGVYIKTQNRMENIVKDYKLGRELFAERVIELKVPTSNESAKNQEELTVENYKIVKNTIEKRLNSFGAQDYTISLNEEDGTIIVELSEDNMTDTYVYCLTADGKVQIKEKDTDNELLSDSMVTKAKYTYVVNPEGKYQVYLELYLTEEGKAKIEEIKNNYAVLSKEIEEIEAIEEKTQEENTSEEIMEDVTKNEENNEDTRKIAKLTIAGTEYDIDTIEKNTIHVKIGGETSNSSSINDYIAISAELATLINSGKYPIQYEIDNNRFIYTDITESQILNVAIFIALIILIIFVVFVIKYKIKGLLVSISYIGFVSILSLILRYANVNISIEGIGAILLVLIINLKINQIILEKTKIKDTVNEAIVSTYKEVFFKLVPIVIITLVFCFSGWSNLISFGFIMFWGLTLLTVYNVTVTKVLLKLKEIE